MRFILVGLLFYMLVTAYFAAVRVARKRQLAKRLAQNASDLSFDRATVAPASSAASAPAISEPGSTVSSDSSENAKGITSKSSPALPIGSPVVLDPDRDLNLAVSLSVTDIVHPESSGAVEIPDLIPTDPAISEVLSANAKPEPDRHPSILEEIAELRPMADAPSQNDPLSRVMHVLQTGDGTMRVAAVYELGEIAAQRHGSEAQELIEQLQQLTQDEDPDVRLQAIAALTKVQG